MSLPIARATRQPVLFLGHGNPMLAITDNPYAARWRALGQSLPRPRAIVVISAHWYGPGTMVTRHAHPPTLHDFGAFPQALFDVRYPAPGDPALADRLVQRLQGQVDIRHSHDRGLDHGAWAVLRHLHPAADIPVLQLSIDADQPGSWHLDLGRALAWLRDDDVLLLGSGNLVHHLGRADWRPDAPAQPWAVEADAWMAQHLRARDAARLCAIETFAGVLRLAVPSAEHYLPLLPILGASGPQDRISFPVDGIDLGSIGMRAVLFSPPED